MEQKGVGWSRDELFLLILSVLMIIPVELRTMDSEIFVSNTVIGHLQCLVVTRQCG